MTTKQIKYVMYLLGLHGLQDERESIVWELTSGRTSKLSEMTYQETNALIKRLQGESPRDRMVGKMISMAHEMGWEIEGGKIDMIRLNSWCQKYSPEHKPLDQIKTSDLSATVTVFEKVYLSFMRAV